MPSQVTLDNQILKTLLEKTVKKTAEETLELFKPEATKKFRLGGFVVGASAETVITLLDEATVLCRVLVAAKSTVVVPLAQNGLFSETKGNKLNLTTSVEAKITGTFYGAEE